VRASWLLVALFAGVWAPEVLAAQALHVTYPSDGHRTSAARIFVVGTAPVDVVVTLNDRVVHRSLAGHFAPSVDLRPGLNRLELKCGAEVRRFVVYRDAGVGDNPRAWLGMGRAGFPTAVMSQESIPVAVEAEKDAEVWVEWAGYRARLQRTNAVELPGNQAGLLNGVQALQGRSLVRYEGMLTGLTPHPEEPLGFWVRREGVARRLDIEARLAVWADAALPVVEVAVDAAVARTGPGTDFARLTPLPRGVRSQVTGREGGYYRLRYGGWVSEQELRVLGGTVPPRSVVRSLMTRTLEGRTECVIPLEVPVPVRVVQYDDRVELSVYHTQAQTDLFRADSDPILRRVDWQQVSPDELKYILHTNGAHQWGYQLRYRGSNLVVELRHPPVITGGDRSLAGVRIALDPGHGGKEDLGTRGPTGMPEKDLALTVALLVRDQLVARGAEVKLIRDTDVFCDLKERVAKIEAWRPTIALSLHYNALPDAGDAENTRGVGAFWYQPQAHDLARHLKEFLTRRLNRSSYGLFWDNLAMTRPSVAPSVLLELGFLINPEEFEWTVDPASQRQLAEAIADGLTEWFQHAQASKPQQPGAAQPPFTAPTVPDTNQPAKL